MEKCETRCLDVTNEWSLYYFIILTYQCTSDNKSHCKGNLSNQLSLNVYSLSNKASKTVNK